MSRAILTTSSPKLAALPQDRQTSKSACMQPYCSQGYRAAATGQCYISPCSSCKPYNRRWKQPAHSAAVLGNGNANFSSVFSGQSSDYCTRMDCCLRPPCKQTSCWPPHKLHSRNGITLHRTIHVGRYLRRSPVQAPPPSRVSPDRSWLYPVWRHATSLCLRVFNAPHPHTIQISC